MIRTGIRTVVNLIAVNTLLASTPAIAYLWFTKNPNWSYAGLWWAYSMAYANVIGLMAAFVMPKLGPRIAPRPSWIRWLAVMGTLGVLAVVGSLVATALLTFANLVAADRFWAVNWSSTKIAFLITEAFGIGTFVVAIYRARVEETTLQLRTRELERERALKVASEARLQMLAARVHPHFLFNALNSVSALIRENPELAEKQVERIARFLRSAIDQTARLIPLEEEIRVVNDYLAIEQTRFGGRIRYSTSIAPEAVHLGIPPMAVQTLVENSVKYAAGPRREGGEIAIQAAVSGDRLQVTVWDDGPGFDSQSRPAGHGLDLLEQRLRETYGDEARLVFTNGAGMSVSMVVPCAPS
jgi:two-component system sensor histidine kinase AlgZ